MSFDFLLKQDLDMFLNTPSNPVATESDMGFDTVHEANESRDMPKPRVTASKPEITSNLMKKLIQQPKVETIDEAGPDTKMQNSS